MLPSCEFSRPCEKNLGHRLFGILGHGFFGFLGHQMKATFCVFRPRDDRCTKELIKCNAQIISTNAELDFANSEIDEL